MRVRFIHQTTRRSGAIATREELAERESVTVGRATDNALVVPGLTVALYHAEIHFRAGRCWVETVDGENFRINRRLRDSGNLQVGDTIRIAQTEIRVVANRDDELLSLEVGECNDENHASDVAAVLSEIGIERGWLARRPLSWIAVTVVLASCFALPMLAARSAFDQAELVSGTAADAADAASGLLRSAWSSGPLAGAHGHLSADCTACHESAFVPVTSAACTQCHVGMQRHAPSAQGSVRVSATCTTCHTEHDGETGLAAIADATCLDCHADLAAVNAGTRYVDVGDFAADHPDFRGPSLWGRTTIPNLRAFSHRDHLSERLRGPQGDETLVCGDCHATSDDGARRLPPRYEADCARCHTLAFDERHPDEVAPHATTMEVERGVRRFYASTALAGEAVDPAAPGSARRRPGRLLTEAERIELTAWVDERADYVMRAMVGEGGVCLGCHSVAQGNEGALGETGEVLSSLRIASVRSDHFANGGYWFAHARFGHGAHETSECADCHATEASDNSADVLMPEITACRDCHGGRDAALGRVSSPCTLCHAFHARDPGAAHELPTEVRR